MVSEATRREVEQLYVRLYPHVSHEYATADSEDCKPDCNGCTLLFILEQVEEEVLVIAQARDNAQARVATILKRAVIGNEGYKHCKLCGQEAWIAAHGETLVHQTGCPAA